MGSDDVDATPPVFSPHPPPDRLIRRPPLRPHASPRPQPFFPHRPARPEPRSSLPLLSRPSPPTAQRTTHLHPGLRGQSCDGSGGLLDAPRASRYRVPDGRINRLHDRLRSARRGRLDRRPRPRGPRRDESGPDPRRGPRERARRSQHGPHARRGASRADPRKPTASICASPPPREATRLRATSARARAVGRWAERSTRNGVARRTRCRPFRATKRLDQALYARSVGSSRSRRRQTRDECAVHHELGRLVRVAGLTGLTCK